MFQKPEGIGTCPRNELTKTTTPRLGRRPHSSRHLAGDGEKMMDSVPGYDNCLPT